MNNMNARYRLIYRGHRGGMFYGVDKTTGKRTSLKTTDKAEATRTIAAMNEAGQQPAMNLSLARVYLRHSDPLVSARTWQTVFEEIIRSKSGENQIRWQVMAKSKWFDPIRQRLLIETQAEHLLNVLQCGKVSINVYLRRMHNFAIDMNWLPASILPKRQADSKGKTYVLFDSRWFEIEKAYATRVTNYVNSISAVSIALPQGNLGEDEGVYNESVANGAPKQFALLDKQTIRADGAATPIEFCDLMSDAGHLIHVKKRSSSATLSHLFSQGSVSADAFLGDLVVRREIRAKLKKLKKNAHITLIPTKRPTPAAYEVVYAILAKDGAPWPPSLPFFSAVNLMHHANRIQNLGFKVSLQHVKQV
jgi:hypothetical protein